MRPRPFSSDLLRLSLILLGVTIPIGHARAACVESIPLRHVLSEFPGDRFACDDTTGVAALAWHQADPLGIQSGLAPIACEEAGTQCPGGGTLGDGAVTIESDWNRSGMEGCPPRTSQAGVGLAVQAGDGAGLIVLLTRDRFGPDMGYSVTAAHKVDPGTFEPIPLACGQGAGRPAILSMAAAGPGQMQITVQFPAPFVYSDCDPDSVASIYLGPCLQPLLLNPARGPVYVRTDPCTTRPDLRRSLWTPTGVEPDASGQATITAAAPGTGECLYVGGTTRLEGIESGAITGHAAIPGGPCSDGDGDGITGCGGDCDDADPARAPDESEVCDLLDNDCDGRIDEGLDCLSTCAAPVENGGDVRVTNAPGTSSQPSLAWTGDGYGIAWMDDRDGTRGLYFARLAPSGARLGPDRRISPTGVMAVSPSLVWTGTEFGLAWTDRRHGGPEVYFARLADDGSNAGPQVRVTVGGAAGPPSLTATGDGFAVVWAASYPLVGGNDLFFRRLDLLGTPIGVERQITNNPAVESGPQVAATATGFGVAWNDARVSPDNPEIFFARLDQDGVRVGSDQRISVGPGTSEGVALVAAGDGFGAAWTDWRSGHTEVFVARLDPAGRPLSELQVSRQDPWTSAVPALAWTGSEFRVAWSDGRDSCCDIYVTALDALGVRIGPELPLASHFSHTSGGAAVAVAGSALGVAWTDHRDLDFEIYMSRLGCHCVDGDGDGYTACSECDDERPEINPGALETCNGEDDDCNAFLDDDADGWDSDSDAVTNACDNCRFAPNADQADLDQDGTGDLCDLADGLIMVMMRDSTFVEWQMEAGAASFSLYRGTVFDLDDPDGDGAASNYGECLASGLAGPAYGDVTTPLPGAAFLYIVTARGQSGETGFGVASSGAPRPNVAPCP